jgi:hypothetical protein
LTSGNRIVNLPKFCRALLRIMAEKRASELQKTVRIKPRFRGSLPDPGQFLNPAMVSGFFLPEDLNRVDPPGPRASPRHRCRGFFLPAIILVIQLISEKEE